VLLENAVLGGIDRGRDPPIIRVPSCFCAVLHGGVSVSFSLRFRGRHCGHDSITGLGRPEVRRPRPARTERLRGAKESMMRSIVLRPAMDGRPGSQGGEPFADVTSAANGRASHTYYVIGVVTIRTRWVFADNPNDILRSW